MDNQIISFIVKDKIGNDNLIFIELNQELDFKIKCTCNNKCCNHCDYIIKKISKITNKNVKIDEEFNLINFNQDYIEITINDYDSVQPHKITFQFIESDFYINCDCGNKDCFNISYCIIQILLSYNKEKEKLNVNKISNMMNQLTF
jgi:hypothetical protein